MASEHLLDKEMDVSVATQPTPTVMYTDNDDWTVIENPSFRVLFWSIPNCFDSINNFFEAWLIGSIWRKAIKPGPQYDTGSSVASQASRVSHHEHCDCHWLWNIPAPVSVTSVGWCWARENFYSSVASAASFRSDCLKISRDWPSAFVGIRQEQGWWQGWWATSLSSLTRMRQLWPKFIKAYCVEKTFTFL